LLTKTRYLLLTIVFFIATGVGTHIVLGSSDFTAILTFTCFDALGAGALLAWMTIYKPSLLPAMSRWLAVLTPLSLLLLAFSFYSGQGLGLPQRTLVAVITIKVIAVIFLAQQNGKTVLSVVFRNPVLLFTGKISYGIYPYHNMIPYFTNDDLTAVNRHLPASVFYFNQYVLVAENLLIVILVAFLSWKLIEQPLLGLKKRFDYRQRVRAIEIA
jgi:peptidoglycan/LPS O-acetylase OafA/YrhL